MHRSITIVSVAVFVLSGCVMNDLEFRSLGTVEASIPADNADDVVVRNNVGEVRVEVDNVTEVTARAVVYTRAWDAEDWLGADADRDLTIVQEGRRLRVENGHLDDSDQDDWKMDLHIVIPEGLDVRVHNGVGDCELKGVSGEVRVNVGVGDLEVSVKSLTAGSLKTGVGDLDVVVSVGGPTGELHCASGVGDVSIALPSSFDGEIDLGTGVGSLQVSGAPELSISRHFVGGSAHGRAGESTASVTARTGTGDLSLRRGD